MCARSQFIRRSRSVARVSASVCDRVDESRVRIETANSVSRASVLPTSSGGARSCGSVRASMLATQRTLPTRRRVLSLNNTWFVRSTHGRNTIVLVNVRRVTIATRGVRAQPRVGGSALGRPHLAEQPHEVPAQHLLGPRRIPATARQVARQVFVAKDVVVPLDHVEHIGGFAWCRDPALRAAFIELALFLAALVVDLESEEWIVRTDADVVLAADIHRVLEVANEVLALRLALRRQ